MPTVAVVEDEEDLREALVEYLEARGLRVVAAQSADAFRSDPEASGAEVVVLDVTMPGESGLSLARWLKSLPRPPGIILATGNGGQADRILGLELGADDYLVKPFEPRELLARIRGLLRRLQGAPAQVRPAAPAPEAPARHLLAVGVLSLDLDSRRLTRPDGALVALTAMETDLLEILASRPGRVLSRAQLLALADGREADQGERSVDVRIARLRRKIEAEGLPTLIRAVRGEGYVFVPPEA